MAAFGNAVRRGDWTQDLAPPDVIIGSSPSPFAAWGAALLAGRLGVPFILEVRDIWPQSIVDVAGVSNWHPGVLALAALERWLYRRADHVLTLLPRAEEHIVQRGGNVEAITWIPNGVELGPPPVPAPMQGLVRVVYMGAHGPANALEAVVEAARQLAPTHGDGIQFDFYGDGPLKESLVRQAADIPTVTFHESIPKREVTRVLEGANVLVANMHDRGLYRHGISFNKLYDYLAAGRPVVLGSVVEDDPIRTSGAGFSVAADDPTAIANAIRHLSDATPEQRDALGLQGRTFVETHHAMGVLAKRLGEVLWKVAQRKGQ